MRIYKKYRAIYGRTATAIRTAVNECIANNILPGYLKEKEDEIVDMYEFLYSEEAINNMMKKSARAEGIEEGVRIGEAQKAEMDHRSLVEYFMHEDPSLTRENAEKKAALALEFTK